MVEVRVRQPVAPGDVSIVRGLADAATLADKHPPFGDAVWRDLAHPDDSALLLAHDEGEVVGALHLASSGTTSSDRRVNAAMVVHPGHRGTGVGTALLAAGIQHVANHGGARILLWAFGVDDRADVFARASGLTPERELWQMKVQLPLTEAPAWPAGVRVRSFEPGRDEAAWLTVNNRAFAADPDQGDWTISMLHERETESWFDPQGFLLAEDDTGIAGFCWTKVHPAQPPLEPDAMGEIYVIGVDPDRQGIGLGRSLVLAGLASLAERGLAIGMLFVDAANEPAVGLYRALGFDTARVDREYARSVS